MEIGDQLFSIYDQYTGQVLYSLTKYLVTKANREDTTLYVDAIIGGVREGARRVGHKEAMQTNRSTGSESSGTLVSSTDCLVCDGGIPSAGYVYAPANEELRHLHEAFVEVHMRDSVDNMLLVSAEGGDRRWIKETYLVQELPDEDDDQPRICPDGGQNRSVAGGRDD